MAGFQLVMRSGPTPGKVYPLKKEEMFIGRDVGNDIVINDAEVSRRHSRLSMQAGGFIVEDLGSTNGTAVNGDRLTSRHVLRVGEVVSFGEHVALVFETVADDKEATVVGPRTARKVCCRSGKSRASSGSCVDQRLHPHHLPSQARNPQLGGYSGGCPGGTVFLRWNTDHHRLSQSVVLDPGNQQLLGCP